jgi:hypothetical protein
MGKPKHYTTGIVGVNSSACAVTPWRARIARVLAEHVENVAKV